MHFANAPRTRRLYDMLRIKGIAPVEGTEAFRALEDFAALETEGVESLLKRAEVTPAPPIVIYAKGEAQALLAEKDAQIKALAEALERAERPHTVACLRNSIDCTCGAVAALKAVGRL